MRSLDRFRGPLFMAVTSAVVIWLYFSGQLSLYIHPRYHLFSLVMALLAVLGTLAALVQISSSRGVAGRGAVAFPHDQNHDHSHDHSHNRNHAHLPLAVATSHSESDRVRAGTVVAMTVSTLIAGATILALLLVPPATLSTQTASNRAINESGLQSDPAVFDQALGASAEVFSSFTVREWAGILRQTSDPAFYQGKPVDVIGFVARDPDNSGVFYLTRFVVSCCSVDAQPVGVPVALANWRETYPEDAWLRISGEFIGNPNTDQTHAIVLNPEEISPVEAPNEPYLF